MEEKINIDLKSKESKVLIVSIPIAVIVGTVLAIIAYQQLGDSYALYTILGGAIVASVITYLLSRPKQA